MPENQTSRLNIIIWYVMMPEVEEEEEAKVKKILGDIASCSSLVISALVRDT